MIMLRRACDHCQKELDLNRTTVFRLIHAISAACFMAAACSLSSGAAAQEENMPLPLKLPKPGFAGTPKDLPPGSNVEKPTGKPRPIPLVPKGTTNLALHKKVTASKAPFSGNLDQITD